MKTKEEIAKMAREQAQIKYPRQVKNLIGGREEGFIAGFISCYQILTASGYQSALSIDEGEEWISVEKQLPEGFTEVLVWMGTGYTIPLQAYYSPTNKCWHGSTEIRDAMQDGEVHSSRLIDEPTHWKKLPSPPAVTQPDLEVDKELAEIIVKWANDHEQINAIILINELKQCYSITKKAATQPEPDTKNESPKK